MIKKISMLIVTIMLSLTLFACSDRKIDDSDIIVSFFTFPNDRVNSYPSFVLQLGDKVTEPEDPSRDGFSFEGWVTSYNGNEFWKFAEDSVEKSLMLYAKWGSFKYDIEYVLGGGILAGEPGVDYLIDFTPDQSNRVLPIPTSDSGMRFLGWYEYAPYMWEGAQNLENPPSFKPGDPAIGSIPRNLAADVTYYAHWEEILVPVTFRSNYPVSGVSVPAKAVNFYYGLEMIFESDYDEEQGILYNRLPDYEDLNLDYYVVEWNTRADGTGTSYKPGEPFIRTARLTLFAVWAPKE